MEVIVLHSVNDKGSRELVANLPYNDGNSYTIIDWYGVHCLEEGACTCFNGEPYPGSSPSAFPELVFYDANPPAIHITNPLTSEEMTIQPSSAWVNIRAAQSVEDLLNRSKYGARCA